MSAKDGLPDTLWAAYGPFVTEALMERGQARPEAAQLVKQRTPAALRILEAYLKQPATLPLHERLKKHEKENPAS